MTPITLTERGREIGVAQLHDAGPDFLWPILEMCFSNARTITRTNEGWFVDMSVARILDEPKED